MIVIYSQEWKMKGCVSGSVTRNIVTIYKWTIYEIKIISYLKVG